MAVSDIIIRFIGETKNLFDALGGTQDRMNAMKTTTGGLKKSFKEMRTSGGRLGMQIKKLFLGFRGFRMEMLSVMFFGMGMKNMFMGLLQPVLQATGIFDLFSAVLTVVFLPILEVLLPYILRFADWLMNLSDRTKLIIGVLTILGIVLGLGMQLFGAIVLGIGGVIMAFSGLWNIISKILGAFLPSQFANIAASIILLIPSINIVQWAMDKFGEIWGGIWNIIEPFWVQVKNEISNFGSDLKTKLKEQGIDIDDWASKFKSALGLGEGGLQGLWDSIKKKWDESLKPTFDAFIELVNKMDDNLPSLSTSLSTLANGFEKVSTAISKIPTPILFALLGAYAGAPFGGVGALAGGAIGLGAGLAVEANKWRPAKQGGGYISQTGLYKLHAGESVSTAGDTFSSSPTINVYGSGMSTDDLVRKISEAVTRDLASLSRR